MLHKFLRADPFSFPFSFMYYDCFEYEDKETYLTIDPSIKCEGLEASRWKVSDYAHGTLLTCIFSS